jgi:RNA polymerase sigma-70 factor (ECF subfamily)
MTPVLARTRPDRSFERLYRRHVGDVYRYALAVMRNQSDAEDVAQTTFLNAYRAFQRGERPEKPQNWLIAIAHNVCRQRFRQSARRPAEVSFEDDIGDRLVEDDDTPTGEDIRRALAHLAFNQRAALVMRELEGRTYAEIAEILDLSTSAVETLIFRARRALREQLETSLTCGEAELAISRQLDGRLGRQEKGALRAHLRQCEECASFARRQRAQRSALKSLAAVPLPASLSSFFGGGAAVGTGLAVKAAVAVTVGVVVGGSAYEGASHAPWHAKKARSAAAVPVVQEVSPSAGIVPAPREHIPLVHRPTTPSAATSHGRGRTAAPGHGLGHANAASPHARGRAASPHARGHARVASHGRGKPAYHGDASIAARHEHVKPVRTRPAAPAHPSHPTDATHPTRPQPHAKPKLPPGPYDAGPPPGAGNGKKSGK